MIVTEFPDDGTGSVTVIGISKFCPTVPPVIVICGQPGQGLIGGAIVIVSPVVDAVWCVGVVESVTVMVTGLAVTAVVGVPPMAPVLALIDSPPGRPVAEYV